MHAPKDDEEPEQWGDCPDTPDETPDNSDLFPPKPIISFPKVRDDVEISPAVRELLNNEDPESLYENVRKMKV